MPPFNISRLSSADIAAMRALNALFATVFDDAASYISAMPSDAYLAAALGRPATIVLVAHVGETLTGGLVAYAFDKLEQERSEIYVYDLAVAETHRRRGIATALITRLQALAADRGAWVIFVQADHGDDPAVALYTKLGLREDVMHFDIDVPSKAVGIRRTRRQG